MASPQKENGFTPIANEILDRLASFPFPNKTGVPIALILFVIRKTWGYQKKTDVISLTQFEKGIGSNRPTVVHWLKYLVKANILVKGRELTRIGVEYGFNKDWEQWKWGVKATQLVKGRKFTSKVALTDTSYVPLTHKRKKENTKETTSKGEPLRVFNPLGAEIIKAFEEVDPKNKNYYGNTTQRKACDFLLDEYGLEEVKKRISVLPKTNRLSYFPTITTPVQLRDKWVQLQDTVERKRSEVNSKKTIIV